MRAEEVEAVLAHEVAHIQNGDMVTMTLLQGVMNTFVIFFSRVLGFAVDQALRGRNDRGRGNGIGSFFARMFVQALLGFFATLVLAWFSRKREFRADAGAAALRGPQAMIGALQALQRDQSAGMLPSGVAAFGIRGGSGILGLLRSHPPLEDRIRALEDLR
jgi:heat shock protein HtpX